MAAYRKRFAVLILAHFLAVVFAGCGPKRETETAQLSSAHRVGPATGLPCRMSCSLSARKPVCMSHVSV